jgi:hypothetical protein
MRFSVSAPEVSRGTQKQAEPLPRTRAAFSGGPAQRRAPGAGVGAPRSAGGLGEPKPARAVRNGEERGSRSPPDARARLGHQAKLWAVKRSECPREVGAGMGKAREWAGARREWGSRRGCRVRRPRCCTVALVSMSAITALGTETFDGQLGEWREWETAWVIQSQVMADRSRWMTG